MKKKIGRPITRPKIQYDAHFMVSEKQKKLIGLLTKNEGFKSRTAWFLNLVETEAKKKKLV